MLENINTEELLGQSAYRILLNALSFPSKFHELTPDISLLALFSSLIDRHSDVFVEDDVLSEHELRLLGAKIGPETSASFLLLKGENPTQKKWLPKRGSLVDPHMGATVFICFSETTLNSIEYHCQGPGIKGEQVVFYPVETQSWIEQRESWVTELPMGVDVVFVWPRQIIALPRYVKLNQAN